MAEAEEETQERSGPLNVLERYLTRNSDDDTVETGAEVDVTGIDIDDDFSRQLREDIEETDIATGYRNDESLVPEETLSDAMYELSERLTDEEKESLEENILKYNERSFGLFLVGALPSTTWTVIHTFPAEVQAAILGWMGAFTAPAAAYKAKQKWDQRKLEKDERLSEELRNEANEYHIIDRASAEQIIDQAGNDFGYILTPFEDTPYLLETPDDVKDDFNKIIEKDAEAQYFLRATKVTHGEEDFPDYLSETDEIYRFDLEVYSDPHDPTDPEKTLGHPQRFVFTGYVTDLPNTITDSGSAYTEKVKSFFGLGPTDKEPVASESSSEYLTEKAQD